MSSAMKNYFLIGLLLCSMLLDAQQSSLIKYKSAGRQDALGLGVTVSKQKMLQPQQGTIPLRPVPLVSFFLDYQRDLSHHRLVLSGGARVLVSFYKGWWNLGSTVPYYLPSLAGFSLDKLDQAELFMYLQKKMTIFRGQQFLMRIAGKVGPAFSINNHLHREEGLVATRGDTRAPFQVCNIYQEKRQPLWLPFLRAGLGLEFIFKTRRLAFITLNPFWETKAFSVDKMSFTNLPEDPQFVSSGNFTSNRHQLGFQLSRSR